MDVMKIKHVILDRDGTLIHYVPYLCDPSKVKVLPTVVEGLKLLSVAGCKLYLHTNQSGIDRGYYTLDDAIACNNAMIEQIGMGTDLFADICIAPERPDSPQMYRKPSAAWGRELMIRNKCPATAFCYFGDNVTDLMTSKNLGCAGVGLNTGVTSLSQDLVDAGLDQDFLVASNFIEATRIVLETNGLNK